jgi:hypothetical protein
VSLEERVEAAVYGLEVRLEDQYLIEAIEVREAWDNSTSGGVQTGCRSDALNKQVQRELMADWHGELARWERFLGLLNAG